MIEGAVTAVAPTGAESTALGLAVAEGAQVVVEPITGADAAGDILAFGVAAQRERNRAELGVVYAALAWVDAHPVVPEEGWSLADEGDGLGGEGTPDMDRWAIPQFAARLQLSQATALGWIGEAVELRHRLPRLWALVRSEVLAVWRARLIARDTIGVSREAARFVDAQLAAVGGRVGAGQLRRTVALAIRRYQPELADSRAAEAAEQRHARVDFDRAGGQDGVAFVSACVDHLDGLDLEHALQAGAAGLKAGGSTESLPVRRSIALGDLARGQAGLDLARPATAGPAYTDGSDDPGWPAGLWPDTDHDHDDDAPVPPEAVPADVPADAPADAPSDAPADAPADALADAWAGAGYDDAAFDSGWAEDVSYGGPVGDTRSSSGWSAEAWPEGGWPAWTSVWVRGPDGDLLWGDDDASASAAHDTDADHADAHDADHDGTEVAGGVDHDGAGARDADADGIDHDGAGANDADADDADDRAGDRAPGVDGPGCGVVGGEPEWPDAYARPAPVVQPVRPVGRGRELVVYLIMDPVTGTGEAGTGRIPIGAETLRQWCGAPATTKITVRPVLDLNAPLATSSYRVPERFVEHVALRDRRCCFPYCDRAAHPIPMHRPAGEDGAGTGVRAYGTDVDHIVPYDHDHPDGAGGDGPTQTRNLGPLCRHHHQTKTFSRWRYTMLRPGAYLWVDPDDHPYLRTRHGTYDLGADGARPT